MHLQELATQVREHTLALLDAADESWLRWAPAGTSNHLLWHAGHSLWLQDVLSVSRLSGRSHLPDGWSDTFGMNCRPVAETKDWPSRGQIAQLLAEQLQLFLRLADEHADRLSQIGDPEPNHWELTRGVIHAWHDEARHQGEMWLLIKLCRSQGA